MFEYLYYLVEKLLSLFKGKEGSDKADNELTKLILDNKLHLKDIINIKSEYTREGLLEILRTEFKIIVKRMDQSIECEAILFEDIEKRTFLQDIIQKLEKLENAESSNE